MPEEIDSQSSNDRVSGAYGAEQITVLEGLEPVRKRPGMYIGGTGPEGLHHLIWELIDNAIDEAMAGFCNRIRLTIHEDNSVSVEDNGRGIPVDKHPKTGKSTLETVLTVLHAGGKFGDGGYKVSSGLHGVGASIVNALSVWMRAEVKRDNILSTLNLEGGKAVRELESKPNPKTDAWLAQPGDGTRVSFLADPTIFPSTEWLYSVIQERIRNNAYLTKGVTFIISDYRTGTPDPLLTPDPKTYTFYFEGGIAAYVHHLNKSHQTITDPSFYVDKRVGDFHVEVALAYADDYSERVYSFANHVYTPEGGTHLTGFRMALTKQINAYGRSSGLLKEADAALTGDDVREGLTAVISVKLPDPQFEGQTKGKLGTQEIRSIVDSVTSEGLEYYFNENPAVGRKIVEKCVLSLRARMAARAARETIIRKGALEGMTLPGKLADCSEKDPSKSELFIVEGDSAGGCFSGDTQIALADGRNLSLAELVAEQEAGKEHYCYTIAEGGHIQLERAIHARLTKKQAEVVRVTLDSGDQIVCTPDHLFMLRDGSYKPAAELVPDDSLMPLYRKLSDTLEPGITIDGYEMLWDPSENRWLFTHVLADAYNQETSRQSRSGNYCRHHIDFNKLNNNPTNLQRLSRGEHLSLHRAHAAATLHRPEVIEKSRRIHQTAEYSAKMSARMQMAVTRETLSRQAKIQWNDPTYKQYMKEKWQTFHATHPEYQEENRTTLLNATRKYWQSEDHCLEQAERVTRYYADNPLAKEQLSQIAHAQWEDETLRAWRQEKTRQQWTPAFRAKRIVALHETYYRKTISALKDCEMVGGEVNVAAYQIRRKDTNDKSLLRFETFCERYFSGDEVKAREAIAHHNHRVVRVEPLTEHLDVYDVEVPGTHNFALAAGVFVHNSAKEGRDRRTQAILPLRGKILNVERARLDRMLSSDGIKNLIVAAGVGVGDQIDYSKLRYHRIVIMTDADVDGAHICTLLLTLFYRHFPDIITKGHLYIAQPPLYGITKGKEKHWALSDEEKDQIVAKLLKEVNDRKKKGDEPEAEEEAGAELAVAMGEMGEVASEDNKLKKFGINIQRFKGLGEMNAGQLWETTMNPENRVLRQVTIANAEKADEVFSMLMGEDVPPRKRFIQTHATTATLDV